MKTSPTLLMKELKAIQSEIALIHDDDEKDSSVPVNPDYTPSYNNGYSYEDNRAKVKKLQKREAEIHHALNLFNLTTKVEGYELTVSEALVRISQLRSEIRILTPLASRKAIFRSTQRHYGQDSTAFAVCYDIEAAKSDLRALQQELAALQVAVDKTNINSSIDC